MSSAKYFNGDTKHKSDCDNSVNFDINVRSLSDLDSSPSVREFLEQERQCTGEDTDEFDFENIFEQINKLQYGTVHMNENNNSTENIEEILFQAEKLVRQSSDDLNSERSASRSNSSAGKKVKNFKKHISSNNSVFISNSRSVLTKESVQNKKWERMADTNKLHEDKMNGPCHLWGCCGEGLRGLSKGRSEPGSCRDPCRRRKHRGRQIIPQPSWIEFKNEL